MIKAVVFDVGETLVDETREYGTWADWLKVPRHTFVSVFGAVIASGKDYRETFQVFKPGFDLAVEREARAAAGQPEWFGEADLYPDVRSALSALRARGIWVGITGNQTVRAGGLLRALDLPTDLIARSISIQRVRDCGNLHLAAEPMFLFLAHSTAANSINAAVY